MRITTDSGTPSLRVQVTKLRRKSWNKTPSRALRERFCENTEALGVRDAECRCSELMDAVRVGSWRLAILL